MQIDNYQFKFGAKRLFGQRVQLPPSHAIVQPNRPKGCGVATRTATPVAELQLARAIVCWRLVAAREGRG
jgi:hypothetical protein